MERPSRDKILQELNEMNHVAYGSYVEQEYYKRLELYVTHLEEQLTIPDVSNCPLCDSSQIIHEDRYCRTCRDNY